MEGKLREILDLNRSAYEMTELVPASGQALDRLAAARQQLREINRAISALIKGTEGAGKDA